MLIAVIAALAVAVLRLTSAIHKSPVWDNAGVAILGIVSALLILFRIIDPPSFGSFGTSFGAVSAEGTAEPGTFLALLAAAGIAFGGLHVMREEGVTSGHLRKPRDGGQG